MKGAASVKIAIALACSFVISSCASVQQKAMDEMPVGRQLITNAGDLPSISGRALRYRDHVQIIAECILLDGSSAALSAIEAAQSACNTWLDETVAAFAAENKWAPFSASTATSAVVDGSG